MPDFAAAFSKASSFDAAATQLSLFNESACFCPFLEIR